MSPLKGICFEVCAPLMSFRKPRYENYQLSYAIPPKTMVAGMIAHAYNRGEKFFYNLLKDFQYGVITLDLKGKFKDLWRAIQGKGQEGGERAVFQREKLFYPHYRIYVTSNKILDKILKALEEPKNPIYLGLSEDLIEIRNVQEIILNPIFSDTIDTIIPINWMNKIQDFEWKKSLENLKTFFPPHIESMITDFQVKFEGYIRTKREPIKTVELLIINGGRFKLKEQVEIYQGMEDDHIFLF